MVQIVKMERSGTGQRKDEHPPAGHPQRDQGEHQPTGGKQRPGLHAGNRAQEVVEGDTAKRQPAGDGRDHERDEELEHLASGHRCSLSEDAPRTPSWWATAGPATSPGPAGHALSAWP